MKSGLVALILGMIVGTTTASPEEADIMCNHMNASPNLNLPAIIDLFLKPGFQLDEKNTVKCDCDYLFQKMVSQQDIETDWPPPENIPSELFDAFTLFGTIGVAPWYIAHRSESTQTVLVWTNEMFRKLMKKKSICGGYKSPICEIAMDRYASSIQGKRGMVIGSQSPWAEAALLSHGAAEIVTVEYLTIDSSHPQVFTMHPHELGEGFLSRSLSPIDFVFSFSSIEHDGLGRYGDPINPFGDLETMARIHCLMPPGGLLFLGVPTGPVDAIFWNAHRVYGRHRMRMILQDMWDVVDFFHVTPFEKLEFLEDSSTADTAPYEEAMWILRKKSTSEEQEHEEAIQEAVPA